MFHVPDKFRMPNGPMGSDASEGNNGLFQVPAKNPNSYVDLTVIASDGGGWEQVSVPLELRCPTWDQMCYIASMLESVAAQIRRSAH